MMPIVAAGSLSTFFLNLRKESFFLETSPLTLYIQLIRLQSPMCAAFKAMGRQTLPRELY